MQSRPPLTTEPAIPTPGMCPAIEIHREIAMMLLIRAAEALIPVRERHHRRIDRPRRHHHHVRQLAVDADARARRRVRPAHAANGHAVIVEEGDVELVVIRRRVRFLVLHHVDPAPARREPAYGRPARGHVLGAGAAGMVPPRGVVAAHGFVARVVAEGPHAVLHDGRRAGAAAPARAGQLAGADFVPEAGAGGVGEAGAGLAVDVDDDVGDHAGADGADGDFGGGRAGVADDFALDDAFEALDVVGGDEGGEEGEEEGEVGAGVHGDGCVGFGMW